MWKPTLPILVDEPPLKKSWVYEPKYDGFRCGLFWSKKEVKLFSRNQKELTKNFPEIIEWCKEHQYLIEDSLPLIIDGEIVILRTEYQAIFDLLQKRGRLKAKDKIKQARDTRPASFMAFDLIKNSDQDIINKKLKERRNALVNIFKLLNALTFQFNRPFNLVKQYDSYDELMDIVFLHQGEGIVAKNLSSTYSAGKRTDDWVKVKNYRLVQGTITGWNDNNDYFEVSYKNDDTFVELGKVKNGFPTKDRKTLTTFIQENGQQVNPSSWRITPSACIDIKCLDAQENDLREPFFHHFRFDLEPNEVTKETIKEGLAQLPKEIEISKPNKHLFPSITKRDYVLYLRQVAPILLPRLYNKRLTMIRYPDGIHEHSFFQKHLPDYAPEYIQTVPGDDDEEDILCQDLKTLLWFGNHAALEFHVPFQTIYSGYPDEMVFDLDPPTLKEFPLAITAAQLIKDMCEHNDFQPFVKTSGKTGLQIHIPLEPESMSFDKTREFMEAVAKVLVQKYPNDYTIERLKKNRGKRMYIDYIQHAPGKTIVAPYSPRATEQATVATPLYWHEVTEQLDPTSFTIHNIPNRLKELGCPFLQMPNLNA